MNIYKNTKNVNSLTDWNDIKKDYDLLISRLAQYLGEPKIASSGATFFCPSCKSKERKLKAYVGKKCEAVFNCIKCGEHGTIIDLIALMENLNPKTDSRRINELLTGEMQYIQRKQYIKPLTTGESIQLSQKDVHALKQMQTNLARDRSAQEHFAEQLNLNKEMFEIHSKMSRSFGALGMTNDKRLVYIYHTIDAKTGLYTPCGAKLRARTKGENPAILLRDGRICPQSFNMSDKFFFICGKPLMPWGVQSQFLKRKFGVIVESETDAIAMNQAFIQFTKQHGRLGEHDEYFPSIISSGGAASFKDEWINLLDDKTPYVLAFDRDSRGEAESAKLYEKLTRAGKTIKPWSPAVNDKKDVKDILNDKGYEYLTNLILETL